MQDHKLTEEEAYIVLKNLTDQYDKLQQEIIDHALEYNLDLYLEGLGRLITEEDNWTGKERGEWYTSTDSCS